MNWLANLDRPSLIRPASRLRGTSAGEQGERRSERCKLKNAQQSLHRVLAAITETSIALTVLPTTGAICLTWAISSSNWSG